jgi:Protein of unknown function (DUF3558)
MRVALAVLALAAVLVGCAGGSGKPTGAAVTASTVNAPADPIPPVRNSRSLADIPPCLLFTPAQLEANQIDQPGWPKDVLGSSGCEWGDSARTRQIRLFVDLGNDVLRNVYAKRSTVPVLELTEVAGHPAIRTMDDVDGATCYFRVAAAERQTFVLGFTWLQRSRKEPCELARALATIVIGNLPPLKV